METFPAPTRPRTEGWLDVEGGHRLWYAELGAADGTPFFWMHGGPGSGSSLRHAGLIDLSRYRLVLLDQRGCGRSQPLGACHHNTLDDLIGDVDALRRHLGIARFLSGGGSWGATLALCHAARHPATVAGLILRAPFLASGDEIDALFRPLVEEAETGSEPAWEALSALMPAGVPMLAHATNRLAQGGGDALAIARAWHRHAQARETGRDAGNLGDIDAAALLARYRVQSHYLQAACFLAAGEVLERAATLSLPTAIFHGQTDRICPPDNARALQERMPNAMLRMVADAGHDPFHPGMARAVADAQRCFARDGDFAQWNGDVA